MWTVATFGSPDAFASKNRTPGRITLPSPRGENDGGLDGADATTAGGGTAATGASFAGFPRFSRNTIRKTTTTTNTAPPMSFALDDLLPAPAFLGLDVEAFGETGVPGRGARGGSAGSASASPYRSAGGDSGSGGCCTTDDCNGTRVVALQVLHRTNFPANRSFSV
jgi:hypothetical protein